MRLHTFSSAWPSCSFTYCCVRAANGVQDDLFLAMRPEIWRPRTTVGTQLSSTDWQRRATYEIVLPRFCTLSMSNSSVSRASRYRRLALGNFVLGVYSLEVSMGGEAASTTSIYAKLYSSAYIRRMHLHVLTAQSSS